jgi:predicted outer membrane repeat protein
MVNENGSSPTLNDCTFADNEATVSVGGGVLCGDNSSPIVTGCLFSHNSAASAGGAIGCFTDASPVITSCTLVENSGPIGAGVYATGSSFPTLERTIVSHSLAGSAVVCDGGSAVTLTCCDVWGNAGGDWIGCIAGQLGTNGNIWSDPLYCRFAEGNFRLDVSSPCRDAPGCGRIGAFGAGCRGNLLFDALPIDGFLTPGAEPGAELPRPETHGAVFVAFPNPAVDAVRIQFTRVASAPARLDIVDVTGRRVRSYEVRGTSGVLTWDGRSGTGARVSPGTYFLKLRDGDAKHTVRVTLRR